MRCYVVLLCVFLFSAPLFSQTGNLKEAQAFYDQGDYQKSFALYSELAAENVNNGAFHYDFAHAAIKVEKWKKAIIEFSIAESFGVNKAHLYASRAMAYAALKDHDEAINDYSKAIFLGENVDYYLNRGVVFFELGLYDKAIRDFESCLRFKSDKSQPELYLGHTYLKKGERVEAALHYEVYLKKNTNPEISYIVSVIEADREDYKKAFRFINDALEVEPKNVKYLDFRADLKIRTMDYKAAIVDLNVVDEIAPNDVLHFVERGTAYHKMGQFELAIKDYDAALKLRPMEVSYLMLKAASQQASRDNLGAIKTLSTIWNLDTNRIDVLIHIADCYTTEEKHDLAIHYYSMYIERDITAHMPYRKRGDSYFYLSRYQDAIIDYNVVINMHPDHPIAFNNRGMSLYHLDKKEAGCKDLLKAHQLGYSQSYLIMKRSCAELLKN